MPSCRRQTRRQPVVVVGARPGRRHRDKQHPSSVRPPSDTALFVRVPTPALDLHRSLPSTGRLRTLVILSLSSGLAESGRSCRWPRSPRDRRPMILRGGDRLDQPGERARLPSRAQEVAQTVQRHGDLAAVGRQRVGVEIVEDELATAIGRVPCGRPGARPTERNSVAVAGRSWRSGRPAITTRAIVRVGRPGPLAAGLSWPSRRRQTPTAGRS